MKLELRAVDLKDKIKDFSQYLATTDRIILSAKFGDGKTFFLNQLRNCEELSEEYKFFTIYPVNYSVAKNEDVFEYIKRDIIFQLKKEELIDNVDLDTVFNSLFNFDNIATLALFLLSSVSEGVFYDKVFRLFCNKKKEYRRKLHTRDQYLASFSQLNGCIYENDGFTTMIRNVLDWMKKDHVMNGPEWKKKKPVLIIEDLDRLDPKHLFRILNVLSAHIDDTTSPDIVTNKFGFSNIVIVMDYETTKHIFNHFYGKDACYEGYMSKFLSREPFRYSIRPYIAVPLELDLSKKLGIPHVFVTFTNLCTRINDLSIRDLKKLTLFDSQDRIRNGYFEFKNMGFSTSLPLFHLIIYMVECGMSVNEIVEDLKLQISSQSKAEMRTLCSEYMRLAYPIFAIMNKREIKYFSYGVDTYSISVRKENDIITEISVNIAESWDSAGLVIIDELDIDDTVRRCLGDFSSCINLAALLDKQQK